MLRGLQEDGPVAWRGQGDGGQARRGKGSHRPTQLAVRTRAFTECNGEPCWIVSKRVSVLDLRFKELLSVLCKGAKMEAGKAVRACSGEVMLVAWSREQNLRVSWSDLCFLPVDSKWRTYLLHLWGCSASRCAWHILIQGILDD